ncbi:hypothetical protein D3C76_1192660 [compost metagenome]|nr:hypothetical protein HMSSN139_40780 [Paenibacillus sp. HMSSN-139]
MKRKDPLVEGLQPVDPRGERFNGVADEYADDQQEAQVQKKHLALRVDFGWRHDGSVPLFPPNIRSGYHLKFK